MTVRDERVAGRALLAVVLFFYAYVIPRGPDHNPDSRLALTYSVVERGSVVVDEFIGTTLDRAVRDGHVYSDKAPGVSFWLAPIHALVRHLPLGQPGGDRFAARYLLTFLGIGVPAALFAVGLFHWLSRFVPETRPRWLAVVGLALGSPTYPYVVHAFGHVPAGMCLFMGAALLNAGGQRRVIGGSVLLGLAGVFEYTTLLPALLLAAWATLRSPDRTRAACCLSGAIAPLAALGAYHSAAFGAPWRTGYAFIDPNGPYASAQSRGVLGIGWPDLRVAVELLFGAHRGLVILAPWVALALAGCALAWRRGDKGRPWVAATAMVLIPLQMVNAGYAVWDGGASWGPRHLTPALPFFCVVALRAVARWPRLGIALVACSVALTTIGVTTGTLPPSERQSTVGDFVLPALGSGGIGNTLGGAAGLAGWWGLAPLGVALAAGYVAAAPRREVQTNSAIATTGQTARASLGQSA